MRWPFTTFATGTLAVCVVVCLALGALLGVLAGGAWSLAVLPLLVFMLAFFRDPQRAGPGGEDELLAPADGVVSDIVTLDDADVGPGCTRIGIFLSVFDVHVNRVPCAGTVLRTSQREGGFHDARDPRAVDENRAATIVLRRADGRDVGVRQITGLIARRIICPVRDGDVFVRGQRYGMIRFGSRTELIVSTRELADLLVKVGDRVRGGETLLARLVPRAAPGRSAPALREARA